MPASTLAMSALVSRLTASMPAIASCRNTSALFARLAAEDGDIFFGERLGLPFREAAFGEALDLTGADKYSRPSGRSVRVLADRRAVISNPIAIW